MFKNKLTSKNLGIALLIISLLLLITEFLAVFTGALFIIAVANSTETYATATIIFIVYSLIKITLPILAIILSIKYLKNKPFKNNLKAGNIVIYISAIYFVLQIILILISNTSIVAFINAVLWSSYFCALGIGLKELKQLMPANGGK